MKTTTITITIDMLERIVANAKKEKANNILFSDRVEITKGEGCVGVILMSNHIDLLENQVVFNHWQ